MFIGSTTEQTSYQQNTIYPDKKVFFRIFKDNKSSWEVGTIEGRVGNMMYIVKGTQFTHKRHLNQIRRNMLNEVGSGPSEEIVMNVIYNTFNIPTPLVAPQVRHSEWKRKAADLVIVNPKHRRYFEKIIQNVNR